MNAPEHPVTQMYNFRDRYIFLFLSHPITYIFILQQCYRLLNVPVHSKQDVVREAFLELAKKYHPDSGSPDADMDKFVAIENAFRTLTKHNTGNVEEAEKVVYDINVCISFKF